MIPRSLREQAGVAEGDLLEVTVEGGQFRLTPKIAIDRDFLVNASRNPSARRAEFVRQVLQSAPKEMKAMWAESKRNGLDKLTMRQIDAVIAEVRKGQVTKRKSTKSA